MDDVLTRHGFDKIEDLDVLAFELGTDDKRKLPDLHVADDVSTRLVTDEADFRLANVVEAGVFPASTWGEADTRAYLHGILELKGHRRWKRPGPDGFSLVLRYLATLRNTGTEGQATVATAGAEVAGEAVRLWGAGTLAGYRGRGAYRALVMERCRHALGATLALAKANTASSAPILRAAGFRPVATERRYALKMAAPAHPRA